MKLLVNWCIEPVSHDLLFGESILRNLGRFLMLQSACYSCVSEFDRISGKTCFDIAMPYL